MMLHILERPTNGKCEGVSFMGGWGVIFLQKIRKLFFSSEKSTSFTLNWSVPKICMFHNISIFQLCIPVVLPRTTPLLFKVSMT